LRFGDNASRSGFCNSADSRFRTAWDSSPRVFRAPERPPAYAVATVRGGTQSRYKVAYLLFTRSRCLVRLYSLSLFTGSLQDLQREYLHGVQHNNLSTGRSCGHWRNSLFSAEVPPMRLARDMPRVWQVSHRVSSSFHYPSLVGARCRVMQTTAHTQVPSWRALTPSGCANRGSNGI
jgi:hypothetical protein